MARETEDSASANTRLLINGEMGRGDSTSQSVRLARGALRSSGRLQRVPCACSMCLFHVPFHTWVGVLYFRDNLLIQLKGQFLKTETSFPAHTCTCLGRGSWPRICSPLGRAQGGSGGTQSHTWSKPRRGMLLIMTVVSSPSPVRKPAHSRATSARG